MPPKTELQKNIQELTELMPERCQDCSRVSAFVTWAALAVERGDQTMIRAREDIEREALLISRNCLIGVTDKDGCFGGTVCNYSTWKN